MAAGTLDASATPGLAADSRLLERLRAQARDDPRSAAKAAATQFEAIFLQQMLTQMRKSLPGTDPFASEATQMQTALFDQHLAVKLAERGTGLAEAITKQLERVLPAARPGDPGVTAAVPPSKRREVGAAQGLRSSPLAPPLVPHRASPLAPAPAAFVDRVMAHAEAAAQRLGVPASYVVGQAALESGWGKHEIVATDGTRSHNLFGIKAGAGWTGRTVEAVTTEVVGGVARRVVQKFRAYDDYAQAFSDYAELLAKNPRYAAGVVNAPDARSFAGALSRGGYATDPAYAKKLAATIATAERVSALPQRLA